MALSHLFLQAPHCSPSAALQVLFPGPLLTTSYLVSLPGGYRPSNSLPLRLQGWKWKWSRSVESDSLRPQGLQPTRLLCPWDFPSKGTRVGCHFLLQGIFPTQGSNPGLLHRRQMLYHLSHRGWLQKKTWLKTLLVQNEVPASQGVWAGWPDALPVPALTVTTLQETPQRLR